MSKNKGKHRSERVPEPAVELQTMTWSLVGAMRPYAAHIVVVVVGVIVVLGGLGVYDWQAEKSAGKASDVYGEVTDVLQAKIVEDTTESPVDDDEMTYPSIKARNEAALAVFDRLQRDHKGDSVTGRANLLRAGVLYDLERYADAIDTYREYLAAGGGDDALAFIAQEGLGYAMEAKALAATDAKAREAGLGDALRSFEQIGAGGDESSDFYNDYALYHQARINATLGDSAKARKLYDELLEKYPTSTLRSSAEAQKALLEG